MGGSEDDEEEIVKGERETEQEELKEREPEHIVSEKTYHQKQTKKQQYFF